MIKNVISFFESVILIGMFQAGLAIAGLVMLNFISKLSV